MVDWKRGRVEIEIGEREKRNVFSEHILRYVIKTPFIMAIYIFFFLYSFFWHLRERSLKINLIKLLVIINNFFLFFSFVLYWGFTTVTHPHTNTK